MKVLVPGGAGYIGSHTVLELIDRGYEVVVLDNLQKGHRKAVDCEFVQADLLDKDKVSEILKKHKVEAVIHFAANSLVGESMERPDSYFRNNDVGGLNLLDAMKENGVKYLVFSSTAATYGEPENIPILETDPTIPTNPYGETKLVFEKIMKWYDKAFGIKHMILRYFNVAGAHSSGRIGEDHDPETHLIPLVLKTALGIREDIRLFGTDYDTEDGTCIRDYIHVTDLADAHILALENMVSKNRSNIYNLGNGNGFSVKQIIDAAREVTGCSIKTVNTDRRPGDPPVLIASSEKIQKELEWSPKFNDINTIIDSAWKWHKENPKGFNDK